MYINNFVQGCTWSNLYCLRYDRKYMYLMIFYDACILLLIKQCVQITIKSRIGEKASLRKFIYFIEMLQMQPYFVDFLYFPYGSGLLLYFPFCFGTRKRNYQGFNMYTIFLKFLFQAYELMAPTINDDLEGTTRTSLQLKAREHAASLALMHVRNSI